MYHFFALNPLYSPKARSFASENETCHCGNATTKSKQTDLRLRRLEMLPHR